jgi:uncharacterized protein (DUF305 family)
MSGPQLRVTSGWVLSAPGDTCPACDWHAMAEACLLALGQGRADHGPAVTQLAGSPGDASMTSTPTRRRIRIGVVAAVLAVVAVLGGCADGAGGSADPSASGAQTFNKADVKFAQTMIPHHEQAIEMSDIMLAKPGVDPEVTKLAHQIKAAQGPEMTTLTEFLTAWNQPLIPDHSAEADEDHWAAEGVLTPEEMQELMAAEGPAGQQLFLEGMIEHHKGAITMVQDEIDDGENPDAVNLAQAIKDRQTADINTMESLLTKL